MVFECCVSGTWSQIESQQLITVLELQVAGIGMGWGLGWDGDWDVHGSRWDRAEHLTKTQRGGNAVRPYIYIY